jgi:hypothetical protein
MTFIGTEVPIPKQTDKFWPSPSNKTKLQLLTRLIAREQQSEFPIILSGCVVDDEVLPAEFICSEVRSQPFSQPVYIDALTCCVEEADDRLLLHCAWEVARGCERLIVISNDTDTVVRLLRFITEWLEHGLRELWVQFGSGERKRHLPLHILAAKLGQDMCKVLVKVHVLTGDDALSRIGTKHAAFTCEPRKYLHSFAESDELSDDSIKIAEEYLVRVWIGAGRKTSCKTFDRARLESHIESVTPKTLAQLPPTSSVIRKHIQRAFFTIRNVLIMMTDCAPKLCAMDYGWFIDGGIILPVKGLTPIPEKLLVLCKCVGKCDTKRCRCAKGEVLCVEYCHTSHAECYNK